MNIFRFALIAGFFITSASAEYFSGVGIGTRLGVNFTNGSQKYTTTTGTSKQSLTASGLAYTLLIDYMTEIGESRFLLGVEGYVGGSTVNRTSNIQNNAGVIDGQVTLKHRWSFGGILKAGVMLNRKVAGFVGVGLEEGYFKANYKNVTFGTSPSFSYKPNALGYLITWGAMYRWADFKIGLGHTYIKYNPMNLRKVDQTISGAQRGLKLRSHEQRIFLSLTYLISGPKKGHA